MGVRYFAMADNAFDFDHIFSHVASAGAIIGAVRGDLPEIAAVVALLWYAVQLWESKTVQGWRVTKGTVSAWEHLTLAKRSNLTTRTELAAAETALLAVAPKVQPQSPSEAEPKRAKPS